MSRTRDNSTYATAAYAAHGQTVAEHRVTKNPKGPLLYILCFWIFFEIFVLFLDFWDFALFLDLYSQAFGFFFVFGFLVFCKHIYISQVGVGRARRGDCAKVK